MSKLLKNLNPEQEAAVRHISGPMLVLAGAGSGKTRVITNRIAYLVEKKVCRPENILAITFTNKAASEMKSRIKKIIGKASDDMTICTSHSLGNRILREFYKEAGLSSDFKIVVEQQKYIMLRSKLRKVTARHQSVDISLISSRISFAKNTGIIPSEMPEDIEKGPLIKRVYSLYEKELAKTGSVDFDDLLLRPLYLLRSNKAVLSKLQKKYTFISVDEYQDTNMIQFELLRLLAGQLNNICAVGDDDQGVYGWRGADIKNILTFKDSFPKTKVIKLERNYRSTNNILKAANMVIRKNKHRTPKTMWSNTGDGSPIELRKADDEHDEAEWVAKEIKKIKIEGGEYRQIALLFRTNAQSRIYEEEFRRTRIPYYIVGGDSFFDSKEVKDLLSYLKFISNTKDELSLDRMLKVPDWKIPKQALDAIYANSSSHNCSVWQAFEMYDRLQITEEQKQKVGAFVNFIKIQIAAFSKGSMSEAFRNMIEQLRYKEYIKLAYRSKAKVLESRLARIDELIHGIELFENTGKKSGLLDYLNELAIIMRERDTVKPGNAVSLLTMHSSKGMEFSAVFLVGLDDEVMPSKRTVEEGGIEEERRLFYVAMTRAMERLYLSWPQTRIYYNKLRKVRMCRFIKDIPEELLSAPIGKREKEERDKFIAGFFNKMREKLAY